ncbi:hypothetical protein N9A28_02225 [Sulfurimonas sp.]|nr:hypothetical protein [Sulfurimonas sp.]
MSKIEKTKRITLIILGLSMSAYLMYSGIEILNYEENNQTKVQK